MIHTTFIQKVFRVLLGLILIYTGIGHLTFLRADFPAQVPDWVPLDTDLVVVLSGIAEILLGLALLLIKRKRIQIGWIVAVFFVLIFPGNIAQYVNHRDAFGLDTDQKRLIRLFFQPVLISWALWSTGAWKAWRLQQKAQKFKHAHT
ncbi:DoxX family protein [Emticicia agri]|uniref:DoxX family membrane protein n=1 Tax=Emticicia agri TaxID=2492393 RepID=A0A4Q5LU06_9BACT|nr:DoxX family membrane protein [Emticicia agri]RYU92985.1 DoxX family membrane protein [Emticicia agri]